MILTCLLSSPLGPLRAALENDALIGLWFEGQKYYPKLTDTWTVQPEHPMFHELEQWLGAYFSGNTAAPCKLNLSPKGSVFQQEVWALLKQIPSGETTTYGEIAKKLAVNKGLSSMSAQAVGGAVGHNPISILIPCHRVVGANKSLTGYAGGLDKKIALLKLESVLL